MDLSSDQCKYRVGLENESEETAESPPSLLSYTRLDYSPLRPTAPLTDLRQLLAWKRRSQSTRLQTAPKFEFSSLHRAVQFERSRSLIALGTSPAVDFRNRDGPRKVPSG